MSKEPEPLKWPLQWQWLREPAKHWDAVTPKWHYSIFVDWDIDVYFIAVREFMSEPMRSQHMGTLMEHFGTIREAKAAIECWHIDRQEDHEAEFAEWANQAAEKRRQIEEEQRRDHEERLAEREKRRVQ